MRKSNERRRLLATIAVAVVVTLTFSTPARAYINAIVSHDLPVLMEIAATEAASYLELGAILAETAALVEQAKEYTTIAKTAWGALEELRQMGWDDLRKAALLGAGRAFPEVAEMYANIDDIRDLDYRDARAEQTLRGMLWEHAYGPGVDYLHSGHDNLMAVADSREHRARSEAKLAARRLQAQAWEEDCERTSADGEGACQAAANRAEIINAILLTDIHETALASLDMQERMVIDADRRELDELYQYDRFFYDVRNYVAGSAGLDTETCIAGQCMYQRYGEQVASRIAGYRARHPRRYPARLPLSFGGEFGED